MAAVLVGGTFAGLLSVTAAPGPSTAHAAPETATATSGAKAPAPQGAAKRMAAPRPPAAPKAKVRTSVVQVVAHPDDDLYFMNPDVSQSLRAGTP